MRQPGGVYSFIPPDSSHFGELLDRMHAAAAPSQQPLLFPLHFVKATFPRMGGRVIAAGQGSRLTLVGLLFPRSLIEGCRTYTLRVVEDTTGADEVCSWAQEQLSPNRVIPYIPANAHEYPETHDPQGDFDIGRPGREESIAVRELQREIWGADESSLYPADLHSAEFGAATSLVARREGRVVGFLFGFNRFSRLELLHERLPEAGAELSIESQLMGIGPTARRTGLAYRLKRRQAELAGEQGIEVIHWTVDALQFPNALLNYGRLGAVAGDFYPDYYSFRNSLNQTPASRLGITWLPNSRRVRARTGAATARAASLAVLSEYVEPVRLKRGAHTVAHPRDAVYAIEIPQDWTGLQRSAPEKALRWREGTDALFRELIGWESGRYLITDALTEGDRCYLVARPSDEVLIELRRS